jgi:hypothetical protein
VSPLLRAGDEELKRHSHPPIHCIGYFHLATNLLQATGQLKLTGYSMQIEIMSLRPVSPGFQGDDQAACDAHAVTRYYESLISPKR